MFWDWYNLILDIFPTYSMGKSATPMYTKESAGLDLTNWSSGRIFGILANMLAFMSLRQGMFGLCESNTRNVGLCESRTRNVWHCESRTRYVGLCEYKIRYVLVSVVLIQGMLVSVVLRPFTLVSVSLRQSMLVSVSLK